LGQFCRHKLRALGVYAIGAFTADPTSSIGWSTQIARDLKARPAGDCLTVTLGRLRGRRQDSRGVLDRLAGNPFPTRSWR